MKQYRKMTVIIEAEQYSHQRHVDEGYLPPGVERRYCDDNDRVVKEAHPIQTTPLTSDVGHKGDFTMPGIPGMPGMFSGSPSVPEEIFSRA